MKHLNVHEEGNFASWHCHYFSRTTSFRMCVCDVISANDQSERLTDWQERVVALNDGLLFEKENDFRQFIHKTLQFCTIGIFSEKVLRLCNVIEQCTVRCIETGSYCHCDTYKRLFLFKTHIIMTFWLAVLFKWMDWCRADHFAIPTVAFNGTTVRTNCAIP